jgi:hypothetical protein
MFPVLVILIGIAVLLFGKRLAVLGAAVGALLGVALLGIFNIAPTNLLALMLPILLGVIGFLVAGFAKGIVDIVLLVLGALGGAAIFSGFFELFGIDSILANMILLVIGGVIGLILVQRFKDWAMILLAGFIGALLITHGLIQWFPGLVGFPASLLTLVLAGAGIVYQSKFTSKDNAGK